MMKRAIRGIGLLFFCCLLLAGCGTRPPDPTAPFRQAWSGVLEGTLHGVDFCATVTLVPLGDGGWQAHLVYTAPSLLAGTELRAVIDAEGVASGSVELSHDQKSIVLDAAAMEGLLLPAVSLPANRDVVSLQKNADLFYLTFSNGATLTVNVNGDPIAYQSEVLCFSVMR